MTKKIKLFQESALFAKEISWKCLLCKFGDSLIRYDIGYISLVKDVFVNGRGKGHERRNNIDTK